MEGKEVRFGVPSSALFANATTLTSTGAVNSMHDSFTPLGGGVPILNMMFGEIAPGGTGSGLYGILILAVITVFVAGLMVGRTPEYLGKKIRAREVKFAALYILTTPAVVLIGTGVAMSIPSARASMLNAGPHGLSEVLYAFTSAGNNNGSAFAGLTGNTNFYNIAGGLAMLIGRFLPMLFVLGLAGSLAAQKPVPATEGTLPTHRPLFVDDARRRRGDRGRAHLLPGPGAGTARGRNHPMTTQTVAPEAPHAPRVGAGLLDPRMLVTQLPAACAKLDPRTMMRNPVMFVVEVGAALSTVLAIVAPLGLRLADRRSGCGPRSSSPTWPRPWPRAGARPRPRRCAAAARRPTPG